MESRTPHKPMILLETGQIDKALKLLPDYKVIETDGTDYLIGVIN